MKKFLVFILFGFFLAFPDVFAQEEGKFRFGLDMGLRYLAQEVVDY
jgi:hypothetical protein